jgi:hypothetical protein
MKNGITIIICSVIIAIGIGTHGYFVGKGVKESQPWHHLSDPLGLLRSIEIPESLSLGFKAEEAENGKGLTFKLKIEDQAYEGHAKADESGNSIGGEITFDEIELKDF